MSRAPRVATAVAIAAVSVGLLAGCGSSGSSSGSSKSPAGFDETTAKQQITSNWEAFFNSKTPTSTRLSYLQEGTQLKAVVDAVAASPLSKNASARVTNLVVDATHTGATVTFDLLSNGSPSLQGSIGTAVLDNGVWKVSKATFCGLARSFASATGAKLPAGCD